MAKAPDERAREIETLYEARGRALRRMAYAITGDADAACEAVQEGFARAYAARASFRGEGSLAGWVWRIVARTAVDQARRARVEVEAGADVVAADLTGAVSDERLSAALRALSPRRRLIVFLRYYADLSLAEIADVCGVREGTVAATLAQARRELSTALGAKEVSS